MSLKAGRLNTLVTVEGETRTANGQGGWTTGWGSVGQLWAEIIGMSGDEAVTAAVERSSQRWRITVRNEIAITPKNRLNDGERVYDVRSVIPDPKAPREALVLICETGAES